MGSRSITALRDFLEGHQLLRATTKIFSRSSFLALLQAAPQRRHESESFALLPFTKHILC
jgi:hypothetical protein